MMSDQSSPAALFCALDGRDAPTINALAENLHGAVDGLKLGLEFFCAHGPDAIRQVSARGVPIFLDLKLHDIPNTVAGAVRSVAPLAPHFLTVHASGGDAMLRAAVNAAGEEAHRLGLARMRLLAVTVLTSLDRDDLQAMGVDGSPSDQVMRLAELAHNAGIDGIVCSPHEIAEVRSVLGPDKDIVVPGIRPAGNAAGDQKRSATPADAVRAGATALVVGRPITQADDSAAAARLIKAEMADGQAD
jgi:orotidine-5'-phosphate decarboxylase